MAKKIGAPIAWTIRAFSTDIIIIPIPIVAAQSAQPIKACSRIIKTFLIFMKFSFLVYRMILI